MGNADESYMLRLKSAVLTVTDLFLTGITFVTFYQKFLRLPEV